jgi:NitT/TauT family transport system ATP-binding protein
MDEPFGALDTITRKQIQLFLRSIFENARIDPTVVFVTHSESEAVFLSSDIYILDSGPATIRHQFKIDLPEVRDEAVRYSTQFTEYVNKLGSLLEDLKKERK